MDRGEVAAVTSPDPALADLIVRLEDDWELEETGKAYWIGYTDDMRAIAERGEAAIPLLLDLIARADSAHARSGAILSIHLIGIEGRVVGRMEEAFTNTAAREALLGLLETPELRAEVMLLLIRDPWPSDVPRLFEVLERGGEGIWAVVKALQRYGIIDPPVHPPPVALFSEELADPVPPELSRLVYPPTRAPDGSWRVTFSAVAALPDLHPGRVFVEPEVLEVAREHPQRFTGGKLEDGVPLGRALHSFTDCDYTSLGAPAEYYYADDAIYLCGMATARQRWLDWYLASDAPRARVRPGYLRWAARHGGLDRIRGLLDADPEAIEHGSAALHVASGAGHADVVELLLRRGAELTPGADGGMPLHRAAKKGHLEVIRVLLGAGAQVDAKNRDGFTALDLAARSGHADAAQALLEEGAAADLFVLASLGATERLAALVAAQPERVDSRDADDLVALHYAARHGHVDAARILLDAGADPEGLAHVGTDAPLHEAVRGGDAGVGRLLPSVEAVGGRRGVSTPLQEAAREGQLEVARVLVERGAQVNATHRGEGRSALHWACIRGHRAMVEHLLANGAAINQRDEDGDTPLRWAVIREHSSLAQLLRERGGEE